MFPTSKAFLAQRFVGKTLSSSHFLHLLSLKAWLTWKKEAFLWGLISKIRRFFEIGGSKGWRKCCAGWKSLWQCGKTKKGIKTFSKCVQKNWRQAASRNDHFIKENGRRLIAVEEKGESALARIFLLSHVQCARTTFMAAVWRCLVVFWPRIFFISLCTPVFFRDCLVQFFFWGAFRTPDFFIEFVQGTWCAERGLKKVT